MTLATSLGTVTVGHGCGDVDILDHDSDLGLAVEDALRIGDGRVTLLGGTYPPPRTTIRIGSGQSLVGHGSPVIESHPVLTVDLEGTAPLLRDVTITDQAAPSSALVQAMGFESARLENVRFIPNHGSTTCIQAMDGRDLHVTGCYAGPPSLRDGSQALAWRVLDTDAVEGGTITGNTFSHIGTEASPVGAIIRMVSTNHEQHHFRIANNSIERIVRGDAGRVIELEGGRFTTITGNGIGRCEGIAAAIRIGTAAGFKGSGNVISSNEIHNVGCPVVSLEGVKHTKVSGNVFTLLPKNHGATVIQDGACVGNEVSGNLEAEK